jgi:RNA polymerase sigma-70 factor (ECF subfamily)
MTTESQLAEAFEQQRQRLLALAHRVLGSRSDAEDAVQEAWLRLSRHGADAIDNLPGWLTTVISRICIDTLRSRAARPEVPIDQNLPELIVTDDRDIPEDAAVLSDSVGLALLVVLGSLRPD